MLQNISVKTSLNILLISIAALSLFLLKGLLGPITLAGILVILIYPLYKKVFQSAKLNKNLAAFLTTLLILLFVLIPLIFISLTLVNEAGTVYRNVSQALGAKDISPENWTNQLEIWGWNYGLDLNLVLRTYFLPLLNKTGEFISSSFALVFANAVGIVFGFLISIVCVFFFLRDGEDLIEFIKRISPLTEAHTSYFLQTFKNVVQAVLLANLLTAVLQGIIGGIGFKLFGLPAPVFWGTAIFFFSLIPFFGPAFVYLPTVLYLYFIAGETRLAVLFLLYNLLVVSSVDNIVKPLIIGSKVKIHPLIVFLSILGGLKVWGLWGIIYGPLVAAFLLLILDIHLKETRQRSLFKI